MKQEKLSRQGKLLKQDILPWIMVIFTVIILVLYTQAHKIRDFIAERQIAADWDFPVETLADNALGTINNINNGGFSKIYYNDILLEEYGSSQNAESLVNDLVKNLSFKEYVSVYEAESKGGEYGLELPIGGGYYTIKNGSQSICIVLYEHDDVFIRTSDAESDKFGCAIFSCDKRLYDDCRAAIDELQFNDFSRGD